LWHKEILEVSPGINFILVGNKIDLENRKVTKAEGEQMAKQLNTAYIETSAKTGENIEDAFRMLALQIVKKFIVAQEV
jgi:small GTP-binding protein